MGDSTIGITPTGHILPCTDFLRHRQFELGDVVNGFNRAKYDRFERWLLTNGQHRVDQPRCRDCYAKLICGGGCYAESFDKTKGLAPMDESSCLYIKETVKIALHYIAQLKKHHPRFYSRLVGSAEQAYSHTVLHR